MNDNLPLAYTPKARFFYFLEAVKELDEEYSPTWNTLSSAILSDCRVHVWLARKAANAARTGRRTESLERRAGTVVSTKPAAPSTISYARISDQTTKKFREHDDDSDIEHQKQPSEPEPVPADVAILPATRRESSDPSKPSIKTKLRSSQHSQPRPLNIKMCIPIRPRIPNPPQSQSPRMPANRVEERSKRVAKARRNGEDYPIRKRMLTSKLGHFSRYNTTKRPELEATFCQPIPAQELGWNLPDDVEEKEEKAWEDAEESVGAREKQGSQTVSESGNEDNVKGVSVSEEMGQWELEEQEPPPETVSLWSP